MCLVCLLHYGIHTLSLYLSISLSLSLSPTWYISEIQNREGTTPGSIVLRSGARTPQWSAPVSLRGGVDWSQAGYGFHIVGKAASPSLGNFDCKKLGVAVGLLRHMEKVKGEKVKQWQVT
jgi:hypothetical protein